MSSGKRRLPVVQIHQPWRVDPTDRTHDGSQGLPVLPSSSILRSTLLTQPWTPEWNAQGVQGFPKHPEVEQKPDEARIIYGRRRAALAQHTPSSQPAVFFRSCRFSRTASPIESTAALLCCPSSARPRGRCVVCAAGSANALVPPWLLGVARPSRISTAVRLSFRDSAFQSTLD